jgi:RNA polymerase sigma-70 factor (ECF subfamily)
MPDVTDFHELFVMAVSGDRVSLQRLLLAEYEQLAEHIDRRIPLHIQSQLSAEDIIQQTVMHVIRHIEQFAAGTEVSFRAWLKAIAENCLKDAIRYASSEKRGGGRRRVQVHASPLESSIVDIVDLLAAGSHTPSRSVARHEAIASVQESIHGLPTDNRRAVELRILQGKSLTETAAIMGRSPRAVQGLVDRAKKKMRADLERLSSYG